MSDMPENSSLFGKDVIKMIKLCRWEWEEEYFNLEIRQLRKPISPHPEYQLNICTALPIQKDLVTRETLDFLGRNLLCGAFIQPCTGEDHSYLTRCDPLPDRGPFDIGPV